VSECGRRTLPQSHRERVREGEGARETVSATRERERARARAKRVWVQPQVRAGFTGFMPQELRLPAEGAGLRIQGVCKAESIWAFGEGFEVRTFEGSPLPRSGLLPESQRQNLALTVLYVPFLLNSGTAQNA
jgi:hypothetical protein